MTENKDLLFEKLNFLTDNGVAGYDPNEHEDWVKVGMIMHEEGFSLSDWESWSMRSGKYDQKDCAKRWKSFHDGGGVTGATITNDARMNGWSPQQHHAHGGDGRDGSGKYSSKPSKPKEQEKEPTPEEIKQKQIDDGIIELFKHESINESIPEPENQIQKEDMINYLEAVFKPNDIINVVTEYTEKTKSDGTTKFDPNGYGIKLKVGQMIENLKQTKSVESVIGKYNHDVGVWVRVNPLDGKGIKNENVTERRHVLVESNDVSTADQVAIMKKLNLPITALISSGGKSVHAIVKIDAETKEQYDERVKYLFNVCNTNGLKVDTQCKNESRLSRLPGVDRGKKKQYLLKTGIGAKSWDEWKIWVINAYRTKDLTEYKSKNAVNADLMGKLKQRIISTLNKPVYKTGFKDLDGVLGGGIRSGLYSIGAVSSLGKTTFCLHIADNVASSGLDVLFFSLEMERAELICKSLSRESFLKCQQRYGHSNYAKTTTNIMTGEAWKNASQNQQNILNESFDNYLEKTDGRLFIFEGVGTIGIDDGEYMNRKTGKKMTVKGIASRVIEHKRITGNKPLVIIDYAQILAPCKDENGTFGKSDKQIVDKNILELKRLSRAEDVPILAISSFNRESYTAPVNMSAFKESGAIEYGSDVLIGLQYKGMDYKRYKDKEGILKTESKTAHDNRIKRLLDEMETKAKNGESQPIEIKILKNRNGGRGTVDVEFYPMFNTFVDKEKKKKNTRPENQCEIDIEYEMLPEDVLDMASDIEYDDDEYVSTFSV